MHSRLIPGLAVAAILFLAVVHQAFLSSIDQSGCEQVWMYPSYAKLNVNDRSKYSIHLYREGAGIDSTTPTGIPVLFVPGHAGSYRQGRSIGSYTAKRHHEDNSLPKFDVFTADFNEDFTAFHGQTMLDQAEFVNEAIKYILSLYDGEHESVILIGHSMGGIVSRTAIAFPNYVPNSVNTIITLATPHTIPPLTFDHDVITVYDLVNQYWRRSFANSDSSNPLDDMALISIVGGRRDAMVPSDYCSTLSIVPQSHGFTTFTSSIPECWTDVDHLAMTWCGQLRQSIAEGMFKMVGRSVEGRVKAFADELLALDNPYSDSQKGEDEYRRVLLQYGSDFEITQTIENPVKPTILDISAEIDGSSSVTAAVWTTSSSRVFKCSRNPNFDDYIDTVGAGEHNASCIKLEPDLIPLSDNSKPFKQKSMKFYNLKTSVQAQEKKTSEFVVILPESDGFLVGSMQPDTNGNDSNGRGISTTRKLPANSYSDIPLTGSNSQTSLIAYKVRVNGDKKKSKYFQPIVRQYSPEPLEARFHVNTLENDAKIIFHSNSPYVPYNQSEKGHRNEVRIQVFTNQECSVHISVDVWGTIANLALRYRIVVATMPIAVAVLVLAIQFWSFDKHGQFYSFYDGLLVLSKKILPYLVVVLSLMHLALANEPVRNLMRRLQIPNEQPNVDAMHAFNPNLRQNDIYLGVDDKRMFFLGPMFFTVAIGLCSLVYGIVEFLNYASCKIVALPESDPIPARPLPVRTFPGLRFTSRRLVIVAVVCLMVMLAVPFQFAFLLVSGVQLANSVRSHRQLQQVINHYDHCDAATRRAKSNFANLNTSLAVLFLWISVVNAPILVVWFHNLVLHLPWRFSHHNILSILPIMLVVENLAAGNMIPRIHTSLQRGFSLVFLTYIASYSILYGALHTYMLHYLVNFLCAWFLVLYMHDPGTRRRMEQFKRPLRPKVL